ncbi:MAG TPA: tRNA-dihydrouridine synthase family protein [Bacteroidales bacterium]|nr:tRNA-dihydrouridine synthase family protein [Bacteroidales bacterium]
MTIPATETKHFFYLAPLQGYTDYIFREAFCTTFGQPDACFSPFIETHKPDHRVFRDVLPERNTSNRLIPQLLGNDADEMNSIIRQLQEMGYDEVNINMGCPYPMVTRKRMGSGLLPHPDHIDKMLEGIFANNSCSISIKMRIGLTDPDEWKALVAILNRYPLNEVIIHGRTGAQLYKGEVNIEAFTEFAGLLSSPVCFNGNIFTLEQWNSLHSLLPGINRWMFGRGLLSNPLLIQEIKTGNKVTEADYITALSSLHEKLLTMNAKRLSGSSHVLNKMKPYWEYFALSLPGREKSLKKIKKAVTLDAYTVACADVFRV